MFGKKKGFPVVFALFNRLRTLIWFKYSSIKNLITNNKIQEMQLFSLSDKTLSKQQEVTSASKMTSRLKEHLQERKQVYSWNFFFFAPFN